ncbi:MAG: hypothetical protein ACRDIU_08330 [Actinomycetota bacterium]
MQSRVAEHTVRSRLFGPRTKYRVDLHGVSVFGPGDERTLIRWEWITDLKVEDSVIVESQNAKVIFPDGVFGLKAEQLGSLLADARSIVNRAEVIGRLSG